MSTTTEWHPLSWQTKTEAQRVAYGDVAELEHALARLRTLPPLVTPWEVFRLRELLADAEKGRRFLLQGGDCAETLADCRADVIENKLKILLQMSLVLVHGTRKPVVRIGRIAGQYAKPRSADVETRGDVTLPAYRGDLINRDGFTAEDRAPDPVLMLRAYERAALTLNFVRALLDGGFADLHHPEYWDVSFAEGSPHAAQYHALVTSIRESLDFVSAVTGVENEVLRRVDIFTSHEALALPYEQATTRRVPRRPGWYNLSTHFPWIGMRTAQLDGAHVEFHRGINNPLGIKIGPGMTTEWLTGLLDALDPQRLPGKITLIHRMGHDKVEKYLPPLVEAVRTTGRTVLWVCDPMHGNTETTPQGIKTRRFDNIVSELEQSFELHRQLGFGSYRTAWFMAHRIREAMKSNDTTLMGSGGGDVFADETYFGRNPDAPPSRTPYRNLNQILTLVDRSTGRSTSMLFDGSLTNDKIRPILQANIAKEARLVTDDARHYRVVGKDFAAHGFVNHAGGEYVSREDRSITTNQIEGFFGIFKRGMRGIYQHCGKQHLHRYLQEFDFRYTNRVATGCDDTERTRRAIAGTVGRRLMYARPDLARA